MTRKKEPALPKAATEAVKGTKGVMAKLAGQARALHLVKPNNGMGVPEGEYEHGNQAQHDHLTRISADFESLSQAIKEIGLGVQKLDWEMQALLVGISVRCVCNDKPMEGVNLANALMDALGHKVVRTRWIRGWLETHAPLKFNEKGKGNIAQFDIAKDGCLDRMRDEFKEDMEGYKRRRLGELWSLWKDKSVEVREFDFNSELMKLVQRASGIDKKLGQFAQGKKPKNFDPAKVNLGIYEDIRKIVKTLPLTANSQVETSEDEGGIENAKQAA